MIDRGLLIQSIHEAAAVAERWPFVLQAIGGGVDAPGAMLWARRSDAWTGDIVSGPGDKLRCQQTTARLLGADRAGFLTDRDLFSAAERCGDAFAATAIAVPTGDRLGFHFQRPSGAPPFAAQDMALLDSLRPALARAGMLSVRWRLQQPRTATAALQTIGLPAAMLDREGRTLAANADIEALVSHVRWRSQDRLGLVDARANSLLHEVLADPRDGRSFAARSIAGEPAVIHAVPVAGQARNIFGGRVTLVVLTPVDRAAQAVRGLFDLTAQEARSLAKASTSRQAELTSLLAGLPRLQPRPSATAAETL
jgi:hypothetical protein